MNHSAKYKKSTMLGDESIDTSDETIEANKKKPKAKSGRKSKKELESIADRMTMVGVESGHNRTVEGFDWPLFNCLVKFAPSKAIAANYMNTNINHIDYMLKRNHKMNFTEYKEVQQAGISVALQTKALESAMKGNPIMLIFCLKNISKWQDKVDDPVDLAEKNTVTLAYNFGEKSKFDSPGHNHTEIVDAEIVDGTPQKKSEKNKKDTK